MADNGAVNSLDGNAREIAYMLRCSREPVEKGSLAAVLLPDKGKGES